MAQIHDVIDSDVRFLIDPVRRTISNQGSAKLMLVRGDHNSERFSFEIPRFVEGHDMSLCNVVRIHYINTDAKTRITSDDVYEPSDLAISPDNARVVHFSWLISRNATTYAGGLAFSIEFQCVIKGVVEYAWHTGINNTITISDGIHNDEVVIENYSDILLIWWERIYGNTTLPIEIHTMKTFEALGGQTKPNTLYLFEDDPTLAEIFKIAEECNYDLSISELRALVTAHNGLMAKMQESLNSATQAILNLKATREQNVRVVNTIQSEMQLLSNRVLALENRSGTGTPDPGDGSHTHSYTIVDTIVDATCKTQGYTVYKCSCGDTETRDYVTALGHNMQETVVEPTCTEEGYTKHVCTRDGCGYSYIDSYVEQTGHSWRYYDDDSTGTTVQSRRCMNCGIVETNVGNSCTNGGDHSWVETAVTDATCTAPAYQNYECSVCGKTSREAIRVPLGHDYREEVIIDGNCTENTYQRYKCSRCSSTYDELVSEAPGHNWSDAIYDAVGYYEPTCIIPGYAAFVCKVCGAEMSDTVPSTGDHIWSDPIYDVEGCYEPTCTKAGIAVRVCSTCSGEKSETVPALGHDWEEYQDPTVSSGKSRRCRVCGLVEEDIA